MNIKDVIDISRGKLGVSLHNGSKTVVLTAQEVSKLLSDGNSVRKDKEMYIELPDWFCEKVKELYL